MTRRRQLGIDPAELVELSTILRALEGAIRDFFSGIRGNPAPLYERLAKDRIRPGDVVITFNYDMGIERALRFNGLWHLHDGYGVDFWQAAESSQVQVYKLHGGTKILPSLRKEFFVETSYGREWVEFWDRLWDRAGSALTKAEEIVIIGYSLPDADERAWELLRDRPDKGAWITVCCGPSSNGIAERFRGHGFAKVCAMTTFEDWLDWTGRP